MYAYTNVYTYISRYLKILQERDCSVLHLTFLTIFLEIDLCWQMWTHLSLLSSTQEGTLVFHTASHRWPCACFPLLQLTMSAAAHFLVYTSWQSFQSLYPNSEFLAVGSPGQRIHALKFG